ncbi:hypothetical protein [Nitratireductor sp. OM-1]|uniref:hypothetical protein n=1 Tax=Nitratireductor sp. OM-1 TaxID=1756988 RepID=UPI0013AEE528|nr:hypothetical protein [Nitratireductor sp. OM-1]
MSKKQIRRVKAGLLRGRTRWTNATALGALGIALAACVTTQPVNKPCGVIIDPLGDVQATTQEGNRRIDAHFERGVRAGCWERSSALSVL